MAGRRRDSFADIVIRLFGIVTYAAPIFVVGLVLVLIVVRRWSRRPAAPAAPPLDPAMRARIRREMTEREP
jgi:peptide/nickel transport system permease protein